MPRRQIEAYGVLGPEDREYLGSSGNKRETPYLVQEWLYDIWPHSHLSAPRESFPALLLVTVKR